MVADAKPKSGRGGKREPKDGKKIGRPAKPKIVLSATTGIASAVLASIKEQEYWCALLRTDLGADGLKVLDLAEKRLVKETMQYLTDRRDGKPAQGVFVGDTREGAQALGRGDGPSYFGSAAHATRNAPGSHKPN